MFVLALINSVTVGRLDKGVIKAIISNFILAEIKCALAILFCLILKLAVDHLFFMLFFYVLFFLLFSLFFVLKCCIPLALVLFFPLLLMYLYAGLPSTEAGLGFRTSTGLACGPGESLWTVGRLQHPAGEVYQRSVPLCAPRRQPYQVSCMGIPPLVCANMHTHTLTDTHTQSFMHVHTHTHTHTHAVLCTDTRLLSID